MIVYNVKRQWFSEKELAERYRREQGLKPGATAKVIVNDRVDLMHLLNALCEPIAMAAAAIEPLVDHIPAAELLDRAYIDTGIEVPDYIPLFLIGDADQRKRVKADREARGWTDRLAEQASAAELASRPINRE